MSKPKERIGNFIQGKIPGRTIYQTPKRMEEVLPDKRKWLDLAKPEQVDVVKAQVEKFREIYRILRNELNEHETGGDLKIITPDTFPDGNTIESHLLNCFPREYDKHIQFACYIEEFVNTFPEDPIRTWVSVPRDKVKNLVGNAINNGLDRYEVYTFLGTYLWSFKGEEHTLDGVMGRLIKSYSVSRIYDSFRVSADKVREIWSKYGILFDENRVPLSNTWEMQSWAFIPNDNIVFQMAKSDLVIASRISRVRRDTKLKLHIPENLSASLTSYFFHYPVDSEGIFNSKIPVIFDNGKTLTIPLVHQSGPIVIAALFTTSELIGLLGHLKANRRGGIIKTMFKHAQEGLDGLDITLTQFNRENHSIELNHLDNRGSFSRLMTGLSLKGVNVDISVLADPPKVTLLKNPKLRSQIAEKRNKVIKLAASASEKLFSHYHIKSRTERVYSRNYNIQGMPKIFHQAIIPEKENTFVYFDIVANDLTMLFNMVNDPQGVEAIRQGLDPYREIASEVFGDGSQRNLVKMFVSPHLYGASDSTIIEDSEGELSLQDVLALKRALIKLYPASMSWLRMVRTSAGKGMIPREYNPIDGVYIPIPPEIGYTVGPAMLIQRYGAILFRAVICGLAGAGYSPSIFVHDSLLMEVSKSILIDEHISIINEQINIVRRSRGLKVISMMIGHGQNWESADKASNLVCLYD